MSRGLVTSVAAFAAVLSLPTLAAAAPAPPSGGHPRIFLTPTTLASLKAKAATGGSAADKVVKQCDDVIANPSDWSHMPGFDFKWGIAASSCSMAYQITGKAAYAAAGLKYLNALLNDNQDVGDGSGGDTVIRQDHGYYIRLVGPYAAMAYDWLHEVAEFSAPPSGGGDSPKVLAQKRFKAWLDWYALPNDTGGYLNSTPGANYHAGYVYAKALMAIATAGESADGAAYWTQVVDTEYGAQIVGKGLGAGGPLRGGDWPEGWQYGPLSVLEYALGARALAENGASFPELGEWANALTLRFYHSLTPDRSAMYVGGDFDSSDYNVPPHGRAALAGVLGPSSDQAAGWAWFARQKYGGKEEILIHDALAEARNVAPADLGSPTAAKWYLADGMRRLYMRSAWDDKASWATFDSPPHQVPDHEHPDASNFVLYRGADALIVDPTPYGARSTLTSNALTVESASVGSDTRPSQSMTPSKADMPWARAGESGIVAARSDIAQAFRSSKANSDVAYAHREFVYLPEGDIVLIDRARTDDASRGMHIRFRAPAPYTADSNGAHVDVGASSLRIFAVDIAGQTGTVRPTPEQNGSDGCFSVSPEGSCDVSRTKGGGEYRVDIPGPDNHAVHVISSRAKADAAPVAISVKDAQVDPAGNPNIIGTLFNKASIATMVVASSAKDGAAGATLAYVAPAGGSRQVVFDAPESSDGHSVVTATKAGNFCNVSITAAAAGQGFAGRPLMFTLGSAQDGCAVLEDKVAPPAVAPPSPGINPQGNPNNPDGGPGGPGGPGTTGQALGPGGDAASEDDSGCGCSTVGKSTNTNTAIALTGLALALASVLARRRSAR